MIKFLSNRYIDVMDYLNSSNPREELFVYLNPFNYFYYRSRPDIQKIARYRMDGFYTNFVVSFFCDIALSPSRQSFDMTSLAPKIFNYCAEKQLSIFFAGGDESEVELFINKIRTLNSGLKISGYCSGYLNDADIINKIKQSGADVVVLGLGNIKQERVGFCLIKQYKALVFTCGAFISQTANSNVCGGAYYPGYINKLNLRWCYRFFKEPHVFTRVVKYYPKFLFQLFVDSRFDKRN
jgi:exopolysaccharide biosynthesis WecB/TagA/CpsF family protein